MINEKDNKWAYIIIAMNFFTLLLVVVLAKGQIVNVNVYNGHHQPVHVRKFKGNK